MRQACVVVTIMFGLLVSSNIALAQSAQTDASAVPRVMNVTGVFRPADGQPPAAVETVTLSIYADEVGGTPLWQETQQVTLDERGRYTVLLGATRPDGIPPAALASGAQWLSTHFERTGEVEGARVRLTSVPYALRAADADTLGGRPAADYLLAPNTGTNASRAAGNQDSSVAAPADVLPGTPGAVAKYVDASNVGPSAITETGGQVGLGTTTPFDMFHVRFTNTGGTATGLTVQNLGNTATSYSGMLFYDQNGALGQFQGFNNVTHEYRINNVARNGANVPDGSINFMTGNTSRFVVASTGNIGIGTTAPSALLEVSNAIPGGPANMWMTSYTNLVGPYYLARRARGTFGAPAAVQNGDGLAGFYGQGYGTASFGPNFTGGMTVQAAQNWSDTAQGTALRFTTTAIDATAPTTRMTLDATGNLGIGTTTVPAASILEVSNAGHPAPFGQVTTTTYAATGQGSLFVGRKARGTAAAPAAVQNGDVLVGILGRGYGATNFNGTGSGSILVRAAETWTDSAQGTAINFNTTSVGTTVPLNRMTLTSSGNLGLGTNAPGEIVEIARNGDAVVSIDAFGTDVAAGVALRTARGTQAAPTAVQAGDALGYFVTGGWDGVGFADAEAGLIGYAAENWTSTTRGAGLAFFTTPIGLPEDPSDLPRMVILPSGEVGIGTGVDVNGFPVVTDKLQVVGDIRVGTTGTNGCVKRFDGTALAGTCSSDRRFKKDITPFAPVLGQLTALQPVHYYWRGEDYPNRHFGNSRTYGLIAQDVEQVLPELVATDDDGYKAVDYSQLPLLTIQAVKELKSENDALKKENDAVKQRIAELDPLKQRVAELERLVADLLATSTRR